MSSRRKGKPQQRIHVDTVPADQDLLTCGKCQQEFYLCNINAFIQHKISKCNREPCHDNDHSQPSDHEGEGTIARNGVSGDESGGEAPHKDKPKVNFQTLFSNKDSLEKIIRDELARSEGLLSRSNHNTSKVDAATITVYSEPSLFTCSTCKSVYSSSWFLIQHVQKSHGLQIYVEPSNSLSQRVANLADSVDDITSKQEVTSPSSERASSSPAVSTANKDLFCPPTSPFLTAGPRSPWNPFSRPTTDLSLIHQGLDQFRRLATLPFRPPGLDTTLQDIYSTRLRQLAANPNNVNSPNQSPGNTATPSKINLSETPSAFKAPNKNKAGVDVSASPSGEVEDRGYKCDTCGKTFRFGATLTAHTRTHTGETPFKCPLCPTSFLLASRLKHHLVGKHRHQALASLDGNGSPEVKHQELSECESVIEDSQEFALAEAQAEAELMMAATQTGSKLNNNKLDPLGADLSAGSSLLSEVMKKTGFDQIPQYKEAFDAARAETGDDEESEDGQSDDSPPLTPSEQPVNGLQDRDTPLRRLSSHTPSPIPAKIIKIEPQPDAPPEWPPNNVESLYQKDLRNAAALAAVAQVGMYPGLWFHPSTPRDFLPYVPTTRSNIFSPSTPTNGVGDNGKVQPPKVNNVSQANPKDSPGNNNTVIRRRNDTCEYCGKIFKNCSNLTVHRRSHTGEKPYKCQLCSYACAQSSKLTRHMRTHGRMGKDVYRCKFCTMPFSVPSTLEKHMRKCMENQATLAGTSPSKVANLSNKGSENQPPQTSLLSGTSLLSSFKTELVPSPGSLTSVGMEGHMTEGALSPMSSMSPAGSTTQDTSLNLSIAAMDTNSQDTSLNLSTTSNAMETNDDSSLSEEKASLAGILTLNSASPENITTSQSEASREKQGIEVPSLDGTAVAST